jgi:hypothetical protein
VVFSHDTPILDGTTGYVDIEPSLAASLVGTPTVEVIDATPPELRELRVENVTRTSPASSERFSFTIVLPSEPAISPRDIVRMTVRTTFEVDCGGGVTRIVHAAHDIHLCTEEFGVVYWVSSGEICVCRVVAEMAPSPIVPDKVTDGLPLARALRLRIVELARVSNALVLLAENDGGDGLEYEWHPSVGRVERLAPDVVVWTVTMGDAAPFIQAAVYGVEVAAVATFSFNEAA